jgi:ABC-type multidrug transport system ATPase subunit
MSVSLTNVLARGVLGTKIEGISLEAGTGVTAIIGRPADGTALLFDVLDGTVAPKAGAVRVPSTVARVTIDAPLPDVITVREVCALAADLRGEAAEGRKQDVLAPLDLAALANRRTSSLSVDERRAVVLAIALGSKAELVLIEEPLAFLGIATRVAADAIRERAKTSCVIVTTSSPRDATRVGDRIAVLADGVLTPIEESNTVSSDAGSLVVVVSASQGREGAATLISALGREEAVSSVEMGAFAAGRATSLSIHGHDLGALAKAVTRAIAESKVNIDLIEPSILPLDAIRAQIASLRT